MKQLLIYDQPVMLNRTRHRHLRVRSQPARFEFAGQLNSVPLTVVEFADAARDYPIVFAGAPDQASMPAVLLGLAAAENLFVQGDGRWDADAYIPAFLRRYPFVVADKESSGEFSVCLDRAFLLDDGDDGEPLFDADGREAPALSRAMKFLADYQGAVERTQAMMRQLRDNQLLIAKSVHAEYPGVPKQTLSGFSVVDETRVQKLSAKVLKELARTGTLGLLYVHLASLGNLKRLARRRDARAPMPPPPPAVQ
jgi:hypothetical protein